ncbi:MAG: transposase [Clostridiales bacterium]|nr:transposase [Clostridiales bacterium]
MRRIEEIGSVLESQNYSLDNIVTETLKKFKIKFLCNQSGFRKDHGFSVTEILTLLLMLPLMALKNVHQLYKSEYGKKAAMKKDALYRLKNNEYHPWRRLLYSVAKMFRKLTNPENKPAGKVTAFIVDDTTDERVGYKMENISHVFDHVLRKTVYGFKILTLVFFDGISSIPMDFTIHAEKKLARNKAKKQYKKAVDPRSSGGKRRKELRASKIEQSIAMIKRAVKNGYIADYVLCDAWFTSKEFIQKIRGIKNGAMHLIAGIRNDKRYYGYNEQMLNAKQIIALVKEAGVHRCRKWNIRYMEVVVDYEGIGDVKLLICRYPGQKKWRVFITTNASLKFVEIMETYGFRWTIEVMFRETKQYLQLGSCQSQDFDAQIASTTITFMLYTFLSYLKRVGSYETMGELFRQAHQDICEKTLAERLWELFEELLEFLIDIIASHGPMDITLLKQSEEYRYVKEVFASSFLFEQIAALDKSA